MCDPTGPLEAELSVARTQLHAMRRRCNDRYRCALATAGKVAFVDSGETLTAWLSNLSRSGIGLNLARSIEPGVELVIQVRIPGVSEPVRLAARVIHCARELDGSWQVGCAFSAPLSDDALESLL
jgi:hypothetical protein